MVLKLSDYKTLTQDWKRQKQGYAAGRREGIRCVRYEVCQHYSVQNLQ